MRKIANEQQNNDKELINIVGNNVVYSRKED